LIEDLEVRERLLVEYRPIVMRAARRLIGRCKGTLELEDLVSVGLLALDRAGQNFDPGRGTTFAYYAGNRVRYAMQDEIRRCLGDVGATRHEGKGSSSATCRGVPCEDLEDNDEEEGVIDTGFEDRQVSKEFWKTAFRECLNGREVKVVRGIIYDQQTETDIADEMGISQQRVSQLYQTALTKLKGYLIDNGLDSDTALSIHK
jgi:RNA polymerase sigma factor (sigma-70 family)